MRFFVIIFVKFMPDIEIWACNMSLLTADRLGTLS